MKNGTSKVLRKKLFPTRSNRQVDAENGFEKWGGYMEAKKAKLNFQLNLAKENGGNIVERIFDGLSVHFNGLVVPPEPELRRLFVLHGGSVHFYRNNDTTYVIAKNLSMSSKNLYGEKTVKPEWIVDSVAAGKLLNYRDYLLYDLNEENHQKTLTQMMKGHLNHSRKQAIESKSEAAPLLSTVSTGYHGGDTFKPNGDENTHLNDVIDPTDPAVSRILLSQDRNFTSVEHESPPSRKIGTEQTVGSKIKMATEEGFLEEFFKNSRLHLISDQKKEMQNKIGYMRKNGVQKFELLEDFVDELRQNSCHSGEEMNISEKCTLLHIDLDCFFVSVGLLSRPHLRGKPVAVTHSTGKGGKSYSDIASASYEARKFGIRNGMWVSEAKKLCPELAVVPYDFDEYRRVSEMFFDTVAKITLNIEASSVDEMVVDATSVLQSVKGATPHNLAEFIRKKIFGAVKCTASVGIGSNRLLAKLATKKAKPNGIFHLHNADAKSFISKLEVRELPGVGWRHEQKLHELFKVKYCEDLLQIPVQQLKQEFGTKTAEKMIQFSKGIDVSELKYEFERPKSISVDVNYGIRFTEASEVSDFLMKLTKELSSRAARAKACGSVISVKILTRKKGAAVEPIKHGGHGIVDSITRSIKLFQSTCEWSEIFRTVSNIVRLLSISPSDYRGIGISLTGLTFQLAEQKKSAQQTIFEMSSSRGKQMLEITKRNIEKKEPVFVNGSSLEHIAGFANGIVKTPPPKSPKATYIPKNDLSSPKHKKRKLLFDNAPGSLTNPATADIDINVLDELPAEIAKEVAQQYGIHVEKILADRTTPCKENQRLVISKDGVRLPSNGDEFVNKNPYAEIEEIDPSYLCALPDSIRNEVLIQFQEAKGRKPLQVITDDHSSSAQSEPQPCSSKQAMERDRQQKSKVIAMQSKDYHCTAPLNPKASSAKSNVDEVVWRNSPSPTSTSSRNSTSQRRFQNRRSLTKGSPFFSKKRLNFEETLESKEENNTDSCGARETEFDLVRFWEEPSYVPFVNCPKTATMPELNGAYEVEQVRNIIRDVINATPNPILEDVTALKDYFNGLISRGYLKQAQVLLKFLSRKMEMLPVDSKWTNFISDIISFAQDICKKNYKGDLNIAV